MSSTQFELLLRRISTARRARVPAKLPSCAPMHIRCIALLAPRECVGLFRRHRVHPDEHRFVRSAAWQTSSQATSVPVLLDFVPATFEVI